MLSMTDYPPQALVVVEKIETLLNLLDKVAESDSSAVSDYESELQSLVQSVLRGSGRTSKADFRREMKQAISDAANAVAVEAFESEGNEAEDLDTEDLAFIKEFTGGQRAYVDGFADWLKDKESDLDQAVGRVDSWVTSMQNFYDQMRARAMGNPRLEFFGDDGADSCTECQEFQGAVHTLKWWQGDNPEGLDYTKRNGNPAFGCGRWETCKHGFKKVKGGEVVIA